MIKTMLTVMMLSVEFVLYTLNLTESLGAEWCPLYSDSGTK